MHHKSQDSDAEEVSLLAELKESLPFPDGMAEPDHMVRATDESRPASPALQALINLSDVELAQEQDPNLRLIMNMIRDSPERPSWEHYVPKVLRSKLYGLSTAT